MAGYKFKDSKLAAAAKRAKLLFTKKSPKKKAKKKASKKRASKPRVRRATAPEHFPAELAHELGFSAPRRHKAKKRVSKKALKKKAKKKASKRRAPPAKATAKKKTPAQLHAMRVAQGKRLAALRKAQLKGKGKSKKKGKSR